MSKKEYEISIWKDEIDTSSSISYTSQKLQENKTKESVSILMANNNYLPILTNSGNEIESYQPFKERKIAIIGTNTAEGENFAHSIKFKKNINGTSTLTFRLFINYLPAGETSKVKNPFIKLITNDTKIKIKFQNEWTDLIVKEIIEYSSSNEIEYKATDLYIEELSKNGLLLSYDDTDFNNIGTIYDLGEKVLANTDWSISEDKSDRIREKTEETIYRAIINKGTFPYSSVYCIRDEYESAVPYGMSGQYIYIFHSSLNKDEMRFQFLHEKSGNKTYTYNKENGLIENTEQCFVDWTGSNIKTINITTERDGRKIETQTKVNLPSFIQSLELITDCRGERIVIPKKTYNDSVLGQLVNVYNYSGNEYSKGTYYGFSSYDVTSLDQKNLFCNSRGVYRSFLKTNLEGWYGSNNQLMNIMGAIRNSNGYIDINGQKHNDVKINEDTGSYQIPSIRMAFKNNDISEIENYGLLNEDNLPNGFTPGEEYTFRVKYCIYVTGGGAYPIPTFLPPSYAYDNNYNNGNFIKITDPKRIPLRIGVEVYYNENINNSEVKRTILTTEVPTDEQKLNFTPNRKLNSSIKGKDEMMIDEGTQLALVQSGSYDKMIGIDGTDGTAEWYEQTLYVNKAISPISKSKLIELCQQKKIHIRVFALRNGGNTFKNGKTVTNNIKVKNIKGDLITVDFSHVRIEDIRLFKTKRDMDGKIIDTNFSQKELAYGVKTLYNYYSNSKVKEIKDISWIYKEEARYMYSKMTPVYEGKILAIKNFSAKDSNRFNLIQKLCEKFNCWAKFNIEHDDNGNILFDTNTRLPKKYITFHNYIGQENKLGFSYGRNLNSIQRTVNSNNITTKIIVKPGINEYGKNGTCDISRSKLNPSRDIYFYDFSYYFNNNFLNRQMVENDLYAPYVSGSKILSFYPRLSYYNEMAQEAADCLISITKEYNNIYEEYVIYSQNKTSSEFDLEKIFLEQTPENWNDWYHAYWVSNDNFNDKTLQNKIKFVLDTYNNRAAWKKSDYIRNGKTETYWYEMFNMIFLEIFNQTKILNIANAKLPQLETVRNYYSKQISFLNQNIKYIRQKKLDLEKAFYNKYSRFIKEGTWTSNDYVKDDSYYLDAMTTLHNSSQPKITYSIQVIDIGSLDEYKYYDFYVGDRTYVQDPEFFGYEKDGVTPYRESIIITEIEYDLDVNENTKITVQNFKDQFESLFQRITAQTQSLQFYQGSYNRAATAISGNGINYSALQQSLNDNSALSISNPQMKNVRMDADGITSTNPRNTSQSYKIGNRGFELSFESGASWMSLNEVFEALLSKINDKINNL